MRRSFRRGWLLGVMTVSSLPVLVGCFPALVVPTGFQRFPTADINAPVHEVTAVHACAIKDDLSSLPGCFDAENMVWPMELSKNGRVKPVASDGFVSIDLLSATKLIGSLSWQPNGRSTENEFRFYRPGYQLVTLRPLPNPDNPVRNGKIQWTPAATAEEQEAALDGLLAKVCPGVWDDSSTLADDPPQGGPTPTMEWAVGKRLDVYSRIDKNHELALFVANEYSRIADEVDLAAPSVTAAGFTPETPFNPGRNGQRLRDKSATMRRVAQVLTTTR